MNPRPPVLLVEDDENDQFFVQRAIKKNHIPIKLHIVSRGDEAIHYLSGTGEYSDRKQHPMPRLVLMDIKMPGRSGLEVLKWIRTESPCKTIPVVMMSSSQLREDVQRAYELGVNAYLIKPAAFSELVDLFKTATDLFVHKAVQPT